MKQEILNLIKDLYIKHHYSEDCWYSCPKHEEGCCDSSQGKECNCAAEKHNKKVDILLKMIEP